MKRKIAKRPDTQDEPDNNGLIGCLNPDRIAAYNNIETAIKHIRHQSENPNPDNSRRRQPSTI